MSLRKRSQPAVTNRTNVWLCSLYLLRIILLVGGPLVPHNALSGAAVTERKILTFLSNFSIKPGHIPIATKDRIKSSNTCLWKLTNLYIASYSPWASMLPFNSAIRASPAITIINAIVIMDLIWAGQLPSQRLPLFTAAWGKQDLLESRCIPLINHSSKVVHQF